MIVSSLCAVVLLGPVADPKPTLEARYRQFNEATAKNDGKAMVAWYTRNATSGFKYTSKDGNTYVRKDFIDGLRDQVKSIKKPLRSTFKVLRVTTKGKEATAVVSTDFEGLVNFDGVALRLVDKSTCRDTWVQGKAGWQLTKSVQVHADTQMFNGS
jgi:hypothetical protein